MGQTALCTDRNLQKFRAPHNADPSAGGATRSAARFRAAERAIWPVGRVGTTTPRAGFWGPGQF
eukprot:9102515-Alexandrium_andersonii.AAC.1